MLLPEPKKVASIIVSRMGEKGEHEEANEQELDPHMEALNAHASDILAAHESKSPHELASAMKAFWDECAGNDSDDE